MITRMKNLLIAVVCLFTAVSAQAQYSKSADQYPTTDYSAAPFLFSLTEVSATLETDTATLATAIKAYISAETPDPILFYAVVDGVDTPWAAATEADAHGFWMDALGKPVGWGDDAKFYASPDVDATNDEIGFYCGQMPEKMVAGDVATATLKLKFNGKEASFKLTLNVIAKPAFDVPEPTVIEKNLVIVGEQEKIVEQFPRGSYDSDLVEVTITDALQLLNITNKEGMSENIGKVIYTTWYNAGSVEEGGGMKKDSLTNSPTAGGHGFWFRPVENANGEQDGEVSATGWGGDDKFFLESFAYNAENDVLAANLGQYPGSCKENETWFANVYIIYGEKAYRIKYTLKLNEQTQGSGLANYTKVGEETVIVEQEPTDDYSTKAVNPDVEAIAAALGCEVSALGIVALDDKDNFAGSTANNGGFWFTSVGTVTSWGASSALFVEPATNGDYSVLNVGQYPNALSVGDEANAYLYFVNGEKYYAYTVTLKITEAQSVEQNFESVATRTFALQSLLNNDYTPMDLITLKSEDLEQLIGTATPTLYGLTVDSLVAEKGKYSNKYSCDPKPGFWLAKDGTVSSWGGESPVGICWVDNTTFRFFQYPNGNSIGDTFTTQLFLVNEETNKMITVNISLTFVETLVEKEVVGSENLVLPATTKGNNIVIDLSKAAEALGVTVDDLMSPNNYYLRGLTTSGIYGEGASCETGLAFDYDGGFNLYGNIFFTIEKSGENYIINIGCNDDVAEDYNVDGQFCFEVNNKQYVYHVKFVSETIAGINTISTDNVKGLIYDLSGCRVENPTHGIYIQDGKKFIVK